MYRGQADSFGVFRRWLTPSSPSSKPPYPTSDNYFPSFSFSCSPEYGHHLLERTRGLPVASGTDSDCSSRTVTSEGGNTEPTASHGRPGGISRLSGHPGHLHLIFKPSPVSSSGLGVVSPSLVSNFLTSLRSARQGRAARWSSSAPFSSARLLSPSITQEGAAVSPRASELSAGSGNCSACRGALRRLQGTVGSNREQVENIAREPRCSQRQIFGDCLGQLGRGPGFMFGQRRLFSAHPYKPKSREVFHPHVPAPEHLPPPDYTAARLDPRQQFVPKDFYRDVRIDTLRDGVNLGSDFPWNVTHKWRYWRRRRYNIQVDDRFFRLSAITGVDFYKRLNVFAVQWRENGQHRIRWFRAAYGLKRALRAAERFRQTLEVTGRVDNWRTARHLREQMLERRQQLKLRKKRFAKISSGQF